MQLDKTTNVLNTNAYITFPSRFDMIIGYCRFNEHRLYIHIYLYKLISSLETQYMLRENGRTIFSWEGNIHVIVTLKRHIVAYKINISFVPPIQGQTCRLFIEKKETSHRVLNKYFNKLS